MDEPTARGLLDLAEDLAPAIAGPDARPSIDRLETLDGDLLVALGWFTDTGRDDEALRLANALYRYWITTRRFDEGDRAFERALASGRGTDALRGRGYL